jgi:hypothetical protein
MSELPTQAAVIQVEPLRAAEQVRAAVEERLVAMRLFVRDPCLGVAVHFGPGAVGILGYNP